VKHRQIYNEVLAHFLTDFATTEAPRNLERYIVQHLTPIYAPGVIDDFILKELRLLRDTLVDEYNVRAGGAGTLRYMFVDDDAQVIQGIGGMMATDRLAFQDGINSLEPAEFETFSAHLLRLATCDRVWHTQETHDEGIDAFGYMPFFRLKNAWTGGNPEVVFLAQAKHYKDTKVGSSDIRELVGASRLAAHRIYSKKEGRYRDLEIRQFAPLALIFVTTQEVPKTVKLMARNAGIVVLTSDDLCSLFLSTAATVPSPITATWVLQEIRNCCQGIPKAA